MIPRLSCLALLLILQPSPGFQTSMSFSGNLERVGDKSISLQLPDRIVIDSMLPDTPSLSSPALAAQYHMGDQVEISCKSIRPVWEAATSRYQSLEVTAIHLQRRLSPEEVSKLLEARPREGKNLLEVPDVPPAAPRKVTSLDAPGGLELEHARRINLEYVANMPNFVADETARRERSGTKSGPWRHYDTVESEITFRGNRAVRQQIRRDGKPWDQPFDALPGFKWYEGFETEISPLFDPGCPTTLEYQGRSKVSGRQLLEYRFTSPVNGCFPFFYFEYQRYNPARTGQVFIDDPGGNVIQVDDEAIGFPTDFEFARREEHVSWDYVKIGDKSHLLPVRANFLILYSSGTRYRIEVEYKNHRHFEASTNLTFH
jgi:hypothetical protein